MHWGRNRRKHKWVKHNYWLKPWYASCRIFLVLENIAMPKPTKEPEKREITVHGLFGTEVLTVIDAPRRPGRQPKHKRCKVIARRTLPRQQNRTAEKTAPNHRSSAKRPASAPPKPPTVPQKKRRLKAGQKRK